MAIKDKKQVLIKEILKSAGTLDSANIKIRLCERLGISPDDYPKSTFLRHLQELVNDGEIVAEDSVGKKSYKLDYDGSDIIGYKYLQKFGGSIHVPKAIQVFGVRIVEGIVKSESTDEVFIVMEISQHFFTLCVSKQAFPFNVHLSRSQHGLDKPALISKAHGMRTITLVLYHPMLSGFKDDKRTGHLLLKFEKEAEMFIEDLGSSHGSASRSLTREGTYSMVLKANKDSTNMTSQEVLLDQLTNSNMVLMPLPSFEFRKVDLPQHISCSSCLSIVVFSNDSNLKNIDTPEWKKPSLKVG